MKTFNKNIIVTTKARNKILFFSWICFMGCLSSCKKDPVPEPLPPVVTGKSVLVLNEGTFNWGNASIDLIDLETNQLHEDIFQVANKRPLGDVLQTMCVIGNEAWLVVNNSMKIERVNLDDFKSTGTIQSLQSPRYILPLPHKVYVSDLYANMIHVIDRNSGVKTGSIPCRGWTEGMLRVNEEAWVCNVKQGKLYVINTTTDQIIDSVKVGDAPRNMVIDKDGSIWVLCEGDIPPHETAGSLWRVDAFSRSVQTSFPFSKESHPSNLCINEEGNQLYFMLNGVFRMPVDATSLPSTAWISQGSRLFYGLSVNHADGSIWVSDAKDYVQRGEVLRFSSSGENTGTWQAGIIPRSFYFY